MQTLFNYNVNKLGIYAVADIVEFKTIEDILCEEEPLVKFDKAGKRKNYIIGNSHTRAVIRGIKLFPENIARYFIEHLSVHHGPDL